MFIRSELSIHSNPFFASNTRAKAKMWSFASWKKCLNYQNFKLRSSFVILLTLVCSLVTNGSNKIFPLFHHPCTAPFPLNGSSRFRYLPHLLPGGLGFWSWWMNVKWRLDLCDLDCDLADESGSLGVRNTVSSIARKISQLKNWQPRGKEVARCMIPLDGRASGKIAAGNYEIDGIRWTNVGFTFEGG